MQVVLPDKIDIVEFQRSNGAFKSIHNGVLNVIHAHVIVTLDHKGGDIFEAVAELLKTDDFVVFFYFFLLLLLLFFFKDGVRIIVVNNLLLLLKILLLIFLWLIFVIIL